MFRHGVECMHSPTEPALVTNTRRSYPVSRWRLADVTAPFVATSHVHRTLFLAARDRLPRVPCQFSSLISSPSANGHRKGS